MKILKNMAKQISEKTRSRKLRRERKARGQLRMEMLEPRLMFALLHQADLDYIGAFRVPTGQFGASSFAYGGTAPAYNPVNNSLFLVGHDYNQAVAEISIPTLVESTRISDLNTSSLLQSFQTIQSRVPDWTLDSPAKIGGLQVVGSQLVGSFYEFYDTNAAIDSHFKLSSLNLASANISGLDQVGNSGGGFVGGYMTAVPPEWQAALGAPYLTGQASLAIISRTSAGPAAFGFNPANLGSTTAPAINYLSYPLAHPLRPETSTNPIYNTTTEITGVVFPPNSSSVIFFGSHGTGAWCYGEAADCNDPVRTSKGQHSYGGQYEYQAWAYDVNDFIAVKNGLKESWQVQPYEVWTFDLPFSEPSKHIGGVAFDPQTGRLYVSQMRADFVGGYDPYPIINVFQLPTGSSTPTGPVLSNVRSTGMSQNTATIQWDTNVASTSRVEFGTSSNFGSFSTLDPTLVSNHSVQLSGLQPDTNYYYRVLSRNSSGTESVSSSATFRTTANASNPGTSIYSYSNPRPLADFNPSSTTTVNNVSQLISAVNSLTSGKTIAIAPGIYDLNGVTDAIYIPQGISNWAIRGATGNRNDVVIRGGGMTGNVRFGFWVGNSTNGTIADLTIDGVQQHGIIANPGAHDMLYHGLRIVDSGDQFIKSNPASPGQGNDRGIVEYSIFEYRSNDNNSYSNGVDVHGGDDWIVRYNLFKNFLNPVGQGVAGPAVLFWNGSTNTSVDGNTFVNNARGISLGLEDKAGSFDHRGGVVSNNMFYRAAGLSSAIDVPIYLADSPDTKIYNNTVLDLGSYPNAIEYRFASSTNVDIRNNLTNKAIVSRDGATGSVATNLGTASASMFANAAVGDLHLLPTSTTAINRGATISGFTTDLDGQTRDAQTDIGADEYVSTTSTNLPPVMNTQSFSIKENLANGSLVGTVIATDPEGSTLAFSILAGNTSNAFVIDPATGVIRVNSSIALDYETRTSFALSVQAVDILGLSKAATVTINLTNVNESPVIATQTFSINENLANGSVVGTVIASDPDSDALVFSILTGNTSNAFVIDPATGIIRVNNSTVLDYETRTSLALSVQVVDVLGLNGAATVTINLINVNEVSNSPPVVGNQSFASAALSSVGQVVGMVVASDPNPGDVLTYTIASGNAGNVFAMNSTTGVITVQTPHPTGTIPPTFVVRVSDQAGLSSSATITVTVNQAPVINTQTFSINENLANGSVVGTVIATDPEGAALAFSILTGNTSNAFAIDPATSVIRVNNSTALDYETRTSFALSVQAVDVLGLSRAAMVTINLINVNEVSNLPPVVGNQSFASAALSSVGQVVGKVVASDPNPGDVLTYTIASGNAGNVFAMNSTTGVITVQTPLPTGTIPPTFVVRVSDQAGLSSSATITVTVEAPSRLVANFPFAEGVGTQSVDQSGGRLATLSGPTWTAGKVGSGLEFDGINDWVTVADDNALDFTTSFTISTWVRPTSLGNWRTAVLKERAGGLAYGLYASDDRSRPAIYINLGGADINATGSRPLPLNTWAHLAATFDGSKLRLFVNGTQVAQVTAIGSIAASPSPLRIGGNAVWGEYLKGRVDEVRLYNSALTATEIASLNSSPSVVLSRSAMETQPKSESAILVSTTVNFVTVGGTASIAKSQFETPIYENVFRSEPTFTRETSSNAGAVSEDQIDNLFASLNASERSSDFVSNVDELLSHDFETVLLQPRARLRTGSMLGSQRS